MEKIHNWQELAQVPESDTHRIQVEDGCCGWIIDKKTDERQYLSTHTFYGKEYRRSTTKLQACGFNIELVSDEATETPA